MVTLRIVDLSQSLAERHLRFGIEIKVTEHQNAVFPKRVHHGANDELVVQKIVRLDASDLSANFLGGLRDNDRAHWTDLMSSRIQTGCHATTRRGQARHRKDRGCELCPGPARCLVATRPSRR